MSRIYFKGFITKKKERIDKRNVAKSVCLGATPATAQGLLLTLHSRIIPGGGRETMGFQGLNLGQLRAR